MKKSLNEIKLVKVGLFEKGTKFEKKILLKFDVTKYITSNIRRKIFSNFLTFSKSSDFK